ncbi:carbohydrate ABC transporter permease [Micromonospora sagamiensis]|uniref:Carbohydrate ABC transporter membrane protein 1, CUT1 family (TC 3.A.1.1.-) n=1 Tax=Micromonospora sagamiensis TaxID=47875 RepID=A0A562WEY6_9ACTN|nr:sugar ABC transporter permease [Micromonospora sagamiensis]TWJ28840.1 carbohydrate ABC transporter membrane protein 1, CUT1 family (TC 3.A.1.1.-) [Micromonospora sagamiensis]BCL18132.1 ABC transporter permease [Micromonospora sagamiensis]
MATTTTRRGATRSPRAGTDRARRSRRPLLPYLLLAPAIVLELAIHVVPMLVGAGMSLLELTQFHIRNWSTAPFAGLENYRLALDVDSAAGAELLRSFRTTVLYTVASVGLSWVLGTTAAVLLQRPFRGRGLLRALFLTPYALPVYTAVITWSFLFQRDTGLLNHVLVDQLHLVDDRPFWLIGDNSFGALLVVSVWRSWPFAFLCVMAGLQNIPGDLYEAAAMDGAGFWRRLGSVTLPMLRPVNLVLLLVLFLWTFNDFNTPYVLFGGSAPEQADLISIHIYRSSFKTWDFGSGSAMSVALLLFLLVVTAGYLLLTNRRRNDA